MNNIFSEYLTYFILVQLCLIPAYILYIFRSRRHSDYRSQSRWLLVILVAAVASPFMFFVPFDSLAVEKFQKTGFTIENAEPAVAAGFETRFFDSEGSGLLHISEPEKDINTAGITAIRILKITLQKSVEAVSPIFISAMAVGLLFFIRRTVLHIRKIERLRSTGIFEVMETDNQSFEICRSRNLLFPFSAGVFRPVIYLPAASDAADGMVIAHEAVHIKNGHIARIWIFELYAALFWFYPVAVFIKKQNQRLQELIADEEVLKKHESVGYVKALLKFSALKSEKAVSPELAVSIVSGKHFKERISNIIGGGKKKPSILFRRLMPTIFFTTAVLTLFVLSSLETASANGNAVKTDTVLKASREEQNELAVDNDELQLTWPIEGGAGRITLGYGQAEPISGFRSEVWFHTGIDIAASVGTGVMAAGDGSVVEVGDLPDRFGKYIIIRHLSGVSTLYAHLSSIKVSFGQNVNEGDIIGAVGNTGKSTGPHLHFAVCSEDININDGMFRNSDYLNPMEILRNIPLL